jgi:hypothetical protein
MIHSRSFCHFDGTFEPWNVHVTYVCMYVCDYTRIGAVQVKIHHSKSAISIPEMAVSLGNTVSVLHSPVQAQKAVVQYELCFWHSRRRCACSSWEECKLANSWRTNSYDECDCLRVVLEGNPKRNCTKWMTNATGSKNLLCTWKETSKEFRWVTCYVIG